MMSSTLVSRSVPLPSPIKLTEEEPSRINIEKQGILTILGKDLEMTKVPPSLRRTFSADMSSKSFLSQNGVFTPTKRIASSEDLNMPGHDDIWRSIQSEEEEKKEAINSKQVNSVWSSILTEKDSNEAKNLPPPYVHPLVKKPSTLNEKSLEICTESLGSETGSDNFSCPPSEKSDAEDDKEGATKAKENEPQMQNPSFEEVKIAKYNYDPSKKMTTPKSFPPPLHSLARKDGPSLQMQSHRTDGRLVLEAVSVPQKTYFQTDRQEGRLVLTLVNGTDVQDSTQESMDDKVANFEEVFDNFEEFEGAHEAKTDEDDYEDEEDDEVEMDLEQEVVNEMAFFMEQSSSSLPISGILNVHKSALMMKSLMGLGNRDSSWSNKLNKAVELMEEQVVAELTPPPIPQSLPPQNRVARLIPSSTPPPVTSYNAYEYFWRNNNTTYVDQECRNLKGNNINKVVQENINHGLPSNDKQEKMVLVKGNNGDYLVPFIKGCKENRRSLLYRQPNCIATS